jgi:hypothetical protein
VNAGGICRGKECSERIGDDASALLCHARISLRGTSLPKVRGHEVSGLDGLFRRLVAEGDEVAGELRQHELVVFDLVFVALAERMELAQSQREELV